MKSFFRKLRDRRHAPEPLIEIRVSRANLLHNLDAFARRVPAWGIAPVLKSNAYGHGLLEVARILKGHPKIPFFVIDSYYEARVVRTAGIDTPLLVIGHTPTETILHNPFKKVAFTVGSLAQLSELSSARRFPSLHLKFDTGMHRQGIAPEELPQARELTSKNGLSVEGVCSHLSDADGADPTFTRQQIARWNKLAGEWRRSAPETKFYHLSATKGVRYAEEIDGNAMRLGIGLYGFDPNSGIGPLRPALELSTRITALRDIEPGESVGYNCTFIAQRKTTVATIPTGYFEGVDRRLSNKGSVRVRGKERPIIGRVSMNMTTIDVTDMPNAKEGDEIEIIGTDLSAGNTADAIAKLCDTIPYDILIHIPAHLRRVVV